MPTPRDRVVATVIGGNIYVAGGSTRPEAALDVLEVFDASAGEWVGKSPLPQPLFDQNGAEIGGAILVYGGASSGPFTTYSEAYAYDPQSDAWIALSNAPMPASGGMVGVIDGGLYVAGGLTARGNNRAARVMTHAPMSNLATLLRFTVG